MKNLIPFLLLFLSPIAYSQQYTRGVTLSSDRDAKNNVNIIADNIDFCDYYIEINFKNVSGYSVRGIKTMETIRRGRNVVTTLARTDKNSRATYDYTYKVLRGNINKKVDPAFVYALPVREGDRIRYLPAKSMLFTSVFNMKYTNDTVYACRGGQVCDDKLTDTSTRTVSGKNRIIIYHDDCSFGEYSQYAEPLVYPGDVIRMGQPIAIIKPDEKNRRMVYFSLYFLDKNKISNTETGLKHSSIVPIFHTSNHGSGKLEEKITYKSAITEEMIMQDMSKKDRAKYLKKKEKERGI